MASEAQDRAASRVNARQRRHCHGDPPPEGRARSHHSARRPCDSRAPRTQSVGVLRVRRRLVGHERHVGRGDVLQPELDAAAHSNGRIAFISDDGFSNDTSGTFTVIAGAAETLVEATALTLATTAGNAFGTNPAVDLRGSHGRNAASSGGSVTWSVLDGCPTGTTPAASTAVATGRATASITVSGVAGSCTLLASMSGVPGTATFKLVVKPMSTAIYWIGAVDDDWTRGAKWSGGTAPDAVGGTDVFVPRFSPAAGRVALSPCVTSPSRAARRLTSPETSSRLKGNLDAERARHHAATSSLQGDPAAKVRLAVSWAPLPATVFTVTKLGMDV